MNEKLLSGFTRKLIVVTCICLLIWVVAVANFLKVGGAL